MSTTASKGLLLLLVTVGSACGREDGGDDFRIIGGTEVDGRNGAVQMKVPKKMDQITDPKKAHWYCSGVLVAEDCVVTAGHCIENVGAQNHVAGATWWHPAKTNNGDNGRPIPAEGETVASATKVAVMGTKHRDLAVVKLSKKLPGPVLALGTTTPALDKMLLVLGNGQTAQGSYAHAKTDMKLVAIAEDMADLGYASLELKKIGENGGMVTNGDSGGPTLFDGVVVGIGSRGAGKPDAAYYTSVSAKKAREWLVEQLGTVCGLEIAKEPNEEEVDDGTTGGDMTSGGGGSYSSSSPGMDDDGGSYSTSAGGSYSGGSYSSSAGGDDGDAWTSSTTGGDSFDDGGGDSFDDGPQVDLGGGGPQADVAED